LSEKSTSKATATVPRPSSSLIAFWAVVAVGVLFLGDSIVRGNGHVFALGFAPVALVVWAVWMALYRPRISFDSDHVVVLNPGRVLDIPWQRVSVVRQRFQVLLELDDGSTVTCWGSPFPEKPGRARPDPHARDTTRGSVVGPLEAARSRAADRDPDAPVVRGWDQVPLIVGGALMAACVVELAIAR
jgi:hypothetical protein